MQGQFEDKKPNGDPKPKVNVRHFRFWITCILLGFSFITYLIPLAAFQLGQLASLKRPATATGLLALVGLGCGVLGIVLQAPLILFAAFFVLLWSPFLLSLVWVRVTGGRKLWSLVLGLSPVILLTVFLMSLPVIPDIVGFLEIQFQSSLKNLPTTWSQEFLKSSDQILSVIKSSVLPELYAISPWQRLLWLTLGNGQTWFISLMTVAIGNIVLTDFGSRHVERIWAIAQSVVTNSKFFSKESVYTCLTICQNAPQGVNTTPAQLVREKEPNWSSPWNTPRILTEFPGKSIQIWPPFRPKPHWPACEQAWGGVFSFSKENSWFWEFSRVPFFIAIGSVFWIVALFLWSSSFPSVGHRDLQIQNAILAWIAQKPLATQVVAGVATWASFITLCLLAAQGFAVLYLRLVKWALFAIVMTGLFISSKGLLPPAGFIGILAIVGFLDEIMGWRNPQNQMKSKRVTH